MSDNEFDLVVIGGGINGACVARDAAGRDLKVLLVERDDLANHAASGSPKIIHGGLRFLRQLELSLARSALAERDQMLRNAPHLVHPLRFVVPHAAGSRSILAVKLESMLFNHLARHSDMPDSRVVDLSTHPAGAGLRGAAKRALEFSDAWTDDARLVIVNCIDAARRGATIMSRTECVACEREENVWRIWLRTQSGEDYDVTARALVNAAGPWAGKLLAERSPMQSHQKLQLVKGSHIVVPRLFDHPYAYAFETEERRHVIVLPYERDYTVIGTCESHFEGELKHSIVDAQEIAWLCQQASQFFNLTVSPTDVRWSYCGVRSVPVGEDAEEDLDQKLDYVLGVDSNGPPIVSIFGGRATTCRTLAERVVSCIQPALGLDHPAWTEDARLPGGEIPESDLDAFTRRLIATYPELPADMLERMACAYGTRVVRILGAASSPRHLGREIAPGLFEAELEYLVKEEWARTADDVLWRRSKLGLHLTPAACAQVDAWMQLRMTGHR